MIVEFVLAVHFVLLYLATSTDNCNSFNKINRSV